MNKSTLIAMIVAILLIFMGGISTFAEEGYKYTPDPKTDYAREFIQKCEGQQQYYIIHDNIHFTESMEAFPC